MPDTSPTTDATETLTHYPQAGSVTWRHIGEWRFLLVLGRLLVLQNAHPVVGAGVAEHSTYRAHPWRRAQHTLESLQRLIYATPAARTREVERIARQHRRINGTDPHGRPYTAADPAARAWVLATVFESVVALCSLSGQPLSSADEGRLYREWRAVAASLGLPEDALPATTAEFWPYFDGMLREVLEDNPSVRDLLGDFYRHAVAPSPLRWCPPVWFLIRPVVARLIVTMVVQDLPAAYRDRLALAPTPHARLLSRSVHRGWRLLAGQLHGGLRYQPYAADAVRLSGPREATGTSSPLDRFRRDLRARKLERFFTHVLDQTGDGYLTWADLEAMARATCWNLDLDDETEAQVHAGFQAWWEQLGRAADADGRISRAGFVAATLAGLDDDPDYLSKGLDRAIRGMFDAIDTDRDGFIGQDEYRRVFGDRTHPAELNHGYRQLDRDGDGRINADEFVSGFREFFTARGKSAAGSHLLGQP
jgi:uncharacterized protein (DUF2236 family)/Ca2+-binding EF-hand superfamily protein